MCDAEGKTEDDHGPANRIDWVRLSIYLCVFAAALIAYPIILLAAGQQSLAVCMAVVIALSSLIAFRLVRQRGRISLAIGVIATPLLIAVCMSSFRYLMPLVQRQRSIEQLERAQIGYKSRRPRQLEHWMTDRAGTLVPVWLTNIIGKDCLTELRSINGQLSDFQRIRYDTLDVSNLSVLKLRKYDDDTRFRPDLIDWLNENPTMFFDVTIDQYTDADANMLGRLERPFSASILVDDETGDLAGLRSASSLALDGDELLTKHFEQLNMLDELSDLRISVRQMPPGAFKNLHQNPNLIQLQLTDTRVDRESLQGIVDAGIRYLTFTNTKLPDLSRLRPAPIDKSLQTLNLSGTDAQETRQLVRLLRCSSLSHDGPLSEEEAEALMDSSSLTNIRVWTPQSYRSYTRESIALE